ncbi:MAG: hypothetical protein AAF074_17485, partial [Pseudomonadota bacterium]
MALAVPLPATSQTFTDATYFEVTLENGGRTTGIRQGSNALVLYDGPDGPTSRSWTGRVNPAKLAGAAAKASGPLGVLASLMWPDGLGDGGSPYYPQCQSQTGSCAGGQPVAEYTNMPCALNGDPEQYQAFSLWSTDGGVPSVPGYYRSARYGRQGFDQPAGSTCSGAWPYYWDHVMQPDGTGPASGACEEGDLACLADIEREDYDPADIAALDDHLNDPENWFPPIGTLDTATTGRNIGDLPIMDDVWEPVPVPEDYVGPIAETPQAVGEAVGVTSDTTGNGSAQTTTTAEIAASGDVTVNVDTTVNVAPAEVEFPDEMDVQVQNWPEAPGLEGSQLPEDAIDVAGGLDFTGDAGSCPASPTATVFGKTVTVSIEPACAFAGILRPL